MGRIAVHMSVTMLILVFENQTAVWFTQLPLRVLSQKYGTGTHEKIELKTVPIE